MGKKSQGSPWCNENHELVDFILLLNILKAAWMVASKKNIALYGIIVSVLFRTLKRIFRESSLFCINMILPQNEAAGTEKLRFGR